MMTKKKSWNKSKRRRRRRRKGTRIVKRKGEERVNWQKKINE